MTREEAIKYFESLLKRFEEMYETETSYWGKAHVETTIEATRLALTALRPVSREQVEKVPRCEHCKDGKSFDGQVVIMGNKGMFPLNFCPRCGSPLTDEAVEMVMERLNKLED